MPYVSTENLVFADTILGFPVLKTLMHPIAVLFTLRTGIDYNIYQSQLIRALGAGRHDLVKQLIHFHVTVAPFLMNQNYENISSKN